jgi:DNA polymerase-1
VKPLYLIDASIYIFRAYFSLPATLVDANGQPANAAYGFADFLARFLDETGATHLAVAFDESLTTSFRNEIYAPYKANRPPAPPELKAQIETCQALSQALGLPTFVSSRYEADDLIGTIASRLRPYDFSMRFVSADKDLSQLIEDGDLWWDFGRNERLDAGGVRERLGVAPAQVVDLIALAGDKVDNIPGVTGIGAKTAVQLLKHFASLDGIYDHLGEIRRLKLRRPQAVSAALEEGREKAYLSQRLARIATDAPIDGSEESLRRQPADRYELAVLCDQLNFGTGLRQRLGL